MLKHNLLLVCVTTWLTEARRRNSDVGVFPDFLKLGVDLLGFVVLVLQVQAAGQAVEGPAVAWLLGEVFAIDLLCFGRFSGGEERRAEGVANGMNPVGRFGITKLVFQLHGGAELGDALIHLSAANENLAAQQQFG